jgi:hypothetical protein
MDTLDTVLDRKVFSAAAQPLQAFKAGAGMVVCHAASDTTPPAL